MVEGEVRGGLADGGKQRQDRVHAVRAETRGHRTRGEGCWLVGLIKQRVGAPIYKRWPGGRQARALDGLVGVPGGAVLLLGGVGLARHLPREQRHLERERAKAQLGALRLPGAGLQGSFQGLDNAEVLDDPAWGPGERIF